MGIWDSISNSGQSCSKQITMPNSSTSGVYDANGVLISQGTTYKECTGKIDKHGKCKPCDYVDATKSEMYNLWILYQKYVYWIVIVGLLMLYFFKKK